MPGLSEHAGNERPNASAPLISRRFSRLVLGLNNSWVVAFDLLQKRDVKGWHHGLCPFVIPDRGQVVIRCLLDRA